MNNIGYVLWCNRGGNYTYGGDLPPFIIVVTKIAPTDDHPDIPNGYHFSTLIDVFVCHDIYRLENVVVIYMQTYGAENVIGGSFTYPPKSDAALQELRRLVAASVDEPCFQCRGHHHVLNCTVADRRNAVMKQNLPSYDHMEARIKDDIVKLHDGPFDRKTVAALHPLTQIILMTGNKMQHAMQTMTISGERVAHDIPGVAREEVSGKILADTATIPADTAKIPTNTIKPESVTFGESTITDGYNGDDILSAGDIDDDPLDQISEAASAAAPIPVPDEPVVPLIAVANKPKVIRSAVWTADEEKMLKILMDQDSTEAEIAEVMNREEFGVSRKISTMVMRDKIGGMSSQDIRTKYHLSDDQVTKYLPKSAITGL